MRSTDRYTDPPPHRAIFQQPLRAPEFGKLDSVRNRDVQTPLLISQAISASQRRYLRPSPKEEGGDTREEVDVAARSE